MSIGQPIRSRRENAGQNENQSGRRGGEDGQEVGEREGEPGERPLLALNEVALMETVHMRTFRCKLRAKDANDSSDEHAGTSEYRKTDTHTHTHTHTTVMRKSRE